MFALEAKKPVNRGQKGNVRSRPAPVGGWNARDPLANMNPQDAVTMINWFPTPGFLQLRGGSQQWATGFVSAIETLIGWNGNSTRKMFAASANKIYDVTGSGAIGAAVVSGLTNNRWQGVNYTTTAGTRYLCLYNGADPPEYYDGTSWTAVTNLSTPGITGLSFATSEFITGTSHKARLWMIRKNSLEAYYMPVGLVNGAAALFDLRPVAKRGGIIVAVETWSADTGQGLDDRLVFITSEGEVIIYQGTDPSSASTWGLVGVYYLGGAPVGTRCTCKFGGDVLILCQMGLLPLSKLLLSVPINVADTITDKIQYAISSAITNYGQNFGWQVVNFAQQNALLINVPTGSTAIQYVMNTITGAWCQFTGWGANCFEIYNSNLYWGDTTYTALAWQNLDDSGAAIATDLKTAFDYLDAPGQLKQMSMVRPILSTDGSPGVTYGVNVDYDDSDVAGTPSVSPTNGPLWDSAIWDQALWGGGQMTIQKTWQNAYGLGYSFAFRMKTLSKGIQLQFSSIDYLFEAGGVL